MLKLLKKKLMKYQLKHSKKQKIFINWWENGCCGSFMRWKEVSAEEAATLATLSESPRYFYLSKHQVGSFLGEK